MIDAKIRDAGRELAELQEERDKLQAFKDWCHSYLDRHGVPHHPPGTHGAEGCRIGDRMDWLMNLLVERTEQRDVNSNRYLDVAAERDKLRERVRELEDAVLPFSKWIADIPEGKDYRALVIINNSKSDTDENDIRLRHFRTLAALVPAPEVTTP